MKAAIMAGGQGTRVKGIFPGLPKPMIPVNGKPLLQWQVEMLLNQGIDDITMVVGYKADVIKAHFGSGINYITEEEPLGTGGALSLLAGEDVLVLFGDVFCDINIKRMTDFHYERQADITLFAHPNSHPYDSDVIVCGEDFRVVEIKSKNAEGRGDVNNLVNAGIYLFKASALPKGPCVKRDMERDIIMPLLDGTQKQAGGKSSALGLGNGRPRGKVYAYCSTEYVKDMGTPERLNAVEADIARGIPSAKNLRQKQSAVFIDRDGTINNLNGLITEPGGLTLIPRAAEAIKLLNASKFLSICVTNQSVVARGMLSYSQLDAIHMRMSTELARENAYLDDLFYCPHHQDGGYPEEVPELKIDCECRKPKPGMLINAAKKHNIDLARSYMIGDSSADVLAGVAAGCKTVYLETCKSFSDEGIKPDAVCKNLYEAVLYILERETS